MAPPLERGKAAAQVNQVIAVDCSHDSLSGLRGHVQGETLHPSTALWEYNNVYSVLRTTALVLCFIFWYPITAILISIQSWAWRPAWAATRMRYGNRPIGPIYRSLQLVQSSDGRAWPLHPSSDGWYPPSAETVGRSVQRQTRYSQPDDATSSVFRPPFRLSAFPIECIGSSIGTVSRYPRCIGALLGS